METVEFVWSTTLVKAKLTVPSKDVKGGPYCKVNGSNPKDLLGGC